MVLPTVTKTKPIDPNNLLLNVLFDLNLKIYEPATFTVDFNVLAKIAVR